FRAVPAYIQCPLSCLPQTSDLTSAPADRRRGGRGDPLTIVSQSYSRQNISPTRTAAMPYRWSGHNWWSTQFVRSSRQFVAEAIRCATTKKNTEVPPIAESLSVAFEQPSKRDSPNQVCPKQS